MNAPSEDIKDMLEAESSLGLIFAENLYTAMEPTTPNDTVTIFDVPGRAPQLTFNKDEAYYYDAVNIRVRGSKYSTAYALAQSIMKSLHGRDHETWNGTLYTVIICTSGPAMLGFDDNRRALVVLNFETQRR